MKYDGTKLTSTNYPAEDDVYELVTTAKTPLQGVYTFEGLEYDKELGTKYLYQVIPKDESYKVTSETTKPTQKEEYGQYALYGYDKNVYGKEIQAFTVGGTGTGAIPNEDHEVTTIDVGYHFDIKPYELKIKKNWDINAESSEIQRITPVVFEISYDLGGKVEVYGMRALSRNQSETNTYAYLETQINGKNVTDYYVSAEYYIYKDKIFKHKYDYSETTATYQSFVADDYYFSLSEYYDKQGLEKPVDGIYKIENIPDINGDGSANLDDLSAIPSTSWKKAQPAGTESTTTTDVIAPFNSVIDRNVGTATTEISITNASEPGTIEILKYTGELKEGKVLSGATFRVYEGEMTEVKQIIDKYNTAQINLNNATPEKRDELKKAFDEAAKEVDDIQVASRTTRINGRVAFSGLNPETTYTVRERFAPSGYRIVDEYYQVNSKNTTTKDAKFGSNNYCLLNIGNSEATGNLEIRKQIEGRAWGPGDTFSFDIAFNYSDTDTSGIKIETSDLSLYSKGAADELIEKFLKNFEGTEDIIIGDSAKYVEKSSDTKLYEGLLNSGIASSGDTSNTAKLKGIDFPVAGLYTFTIRENELETLDTHLKISPKVFTIAINVVRTFNSGVPEGAVESLDNTHLEASISKITVQDIIDDEYGETSIYAGNTPTFVNEYVVNTVKQNTEYVIKKEFTGREWLDTDEFTFAVDGVDDVTKDAIRNENLKIEANFNEMETEDPYATEKTFTISKNTPDHAFKIDKIDFQEIHFPVDTDESGKHITKPLVYTITIKEKIPEGAEGNLYKGITYSNNIYTLKMTLENAANEEGETDGIIDKITLHLSNTNNSTVAECVINQRKGGPGEPEVVVEETHAPDASHIMTFENKYKTNNISWKPIVRKTLKGRDWVANDNFRFAVNANKVAGKAGVIVPSATNLYINVKPDSHSSRADGESFVGRLSSSIVFTAPGTYEFSIHEMFNNENGIAVETTEFPIKVEVTDDGEGHLLAKYNDNDEDSAIEFVNTYTEQGKFSFEISKELKNRKWADGDTFNFTITPNEKTKTAIKNETIKMPETMGSLENDKYTVSISKGDRDLSTGIKIKEFGDIIFTKGSVEGDKYTFTIQEQTEKLNQIECNNDKAILDVNVVRETNDSGVPTGNLNIVATQSYMSKNLSSKVINTNKTKEVVNVEKGKNNQNEENITKEENANEEEQENEKTKIVSTKTNASVETSTETDKTQEKESINNESNKNNMQISNANSDETNGQDTAETNGLDNSNISQMSLNEEELTKSITIQFENYAYTEKGFDIEKVLSGREWKPSEGFNIKVAITKTVDDDSIQCINEENLDNISLTSSNKSKNLKFKIYKEGTYTFNVNEIIPINKLSGLTYDNNVYTVNITVSDNSNGKLIPTMTITNSKGEVISGEKLKFNNIYTTGNLTVKNIVSGTTNDKEKEFTFKIKLSDSTINGTYGSVDFVNGEATIKLKHDKSVDILNLPTGITYTVEQEDANKNGYETTDNGSKGTITAGTTNTVEFTNTRYLSLKLTGGTNEFWIIYKMVIIINIILGIILLKKFKYHKK